MKKLIGLIGFTCMCAVMSLAQNVGIAEPAPNSKLDVVQTETTGNTLEVTHGITTNGSSSAWIKNSGTGYGLHVQNLLTSSNSPVARFLQLGTGGAAHGQLISMNGTTIAGTTGQYIDQLGLGLGSFTNMGNAASASAGNYIQHVGSGNALRLLQNGTGLGIYNEVAGSYGVLNVLNSNTIGTINLMNAGGTGEYIGLGVNNGIGVQVVAVDNVTTPTAGGDVFAFNGAVRTATPTGAFVNGGILFGVQSGQGHGILINHYGVAGRNAEFSIRNAANSDPTVYALNYGQGSAVLAQNQNNVIAGTIYVGDFGYTGTDIADHCGVSGYSQPAANWGIGVLGQGGWYGTFSLGNSGATGVKSFAIDHPEDPENKVLKHFSIESNEVLNLYRGVVTLDGNGKATVELPTYFDLINTNFSYQLTAIGTPQQPYVLTEIAGNTFEVAGQPNSKVSWTVYADRNDKYLQQNAEEGLDVVQKTGERQGKYLNPELYGMPKSSAMFPKTTPQTGGQINPNGAQSTNTQEVRQKALNTGEVQMSTGTTDPSEQ
ncbi:MAG: hypothetical protein P8H56_01840 [Crocinitomicaceae bacterium]|nr:hypothetical protein [Crocinitomicaceae bacterium]